MVKEKKLLNKIKVMLFSIGLTEKYVAFDYLATILEYMIEHDSSTASYKQAINIVCNKFNITERTATQGLSKILKLCNNDEITNKLQFKVLNNSSLNKIRVIKDYIETIL